MSVLQPIPTPNASLERMRRVKIALLVVGGIVVLALVAAVVRVVQYHDVAKPGVHVLGVDVGGQSRSQIAKLVSDWDAHPVTITVGPRSYHVQRGWLVAVDAEATAARALSAGSALALVSAKRVDVAPALGRAGSAKNVLAALARSNRDPVSATVRLEGTKVLTTPGHVGLRLEPERLLGLLEQNNSVVRAPFAVIAPLVTTADARAAAAQAKTLVAAPVLIDYHGANRGSLTPRQIAKAVQITPAAQGLDVSLEGVRAREDPAAAPRQVDRASPQRAVRRQGKQGARRSVEAGTRPCAVPGRDRRRDRRRGRERRRAVAGPAARPT